MGQFHIRPAASRPSALTIEQLIDRYLAAEGPGLAPAHIANKKINLAKLAVDFGELPAAAFEPLQLSAWLADRTEWASGWTIDRGLRDVKRLFSWAVANGLLRENRIAAVKTPRGKIKKRGRCMDDSEYERALAVSQLDFRETLWFARFTGARPGEIRHLKWPMVDLHTAIAELTEHKALATMRRYRPRKIALHPKIVWLLKELQCKRRNPDFVFVTARGVPWTKNNLCGRWRRVRKKAGLPDDCKMYGLRHTFATQALMRDVPLKVLSELMGHSSVRTTEIYLHLFDEDERLASAAAQVFD